MMLRYEARSLRQFAQQLLLAGGLEADKAFVVAETLLEGDLLGHSTHGLQLLPAYLDELEKGSMTRQGSPITISDFPAAVTWDGQRLPGPWLVVRAIDLAVQRAKTNGTCTVVIRRSHHTAALAAYLQRVADAGLMILLSCSDPGFTGVAPHGAKRGVYSPNPIAAAWPAGGSPVLIDVSMSILSMGALRRAKNEKQSLPQKWLVDAYGQPTDDPNAYFTDPPGAILPIGGIDHGHKGFALGLIVEALTGGLAGRGRAEPREGWSANVCVQVFDPRAFGGADEFARQMTWLASACRQSPPRDPKQPVRLPGDAALHRKSEQLANGVLLPENTISPLRNWAEKLKINPPIPLS